MSELTKLVAIAVMGTAAMAVGVVHVQGSKVPPAPAIQQQAAARPAPASDATATLFADPRGHFMADLQIRGIVIRAMVDTGASVLSFSAEDAGRFGLRAEAGHEKKRFQTANGIVVASMVRIPEVRLQGITVYDVEAAVMPPGAMTGTLLGMSFMKKLRSYESRGASMVLRN